MRHYPAITTVRISLQHMSIEIALVAFEVEGLTPQVGQVEAHETGRQRHLTLDHQRFVISQLVHTTRVDIGALPSSGCQPQGIGRVHVVDGHELAIAVTACRGHTRHLAVGFQGQRVEGVPEVHLVARKLAHTVHQGHCSRGIQRRAWLEFTA